MNRTKIERLRADISQEELAQKLGVQRRTIMRWEGGGSIPSQKVKDMAKLFGCSADYLLGLTDSREV